MPFVDLSASAVDSRRADGNSGGDLVTQLRPGAQISARSGRVRGNLDIAVNAIHHSRAVQGDRDQLQTNLNGNLNAELVERWLFLDATAAVTQQLLSAYGDQRLDPTLVNGNRIEVAQLSLRPSARGQLGTLASYQLGLNLDEVQARGSAAPDSSTRALTLALASANTVARLGWTLNASAQRSHYTTAIGAQDSENDRVSAAVVLRPDIESTLALRGGQETAAVPGFYRRSNATVGANLRWQPGPRTTWVADTESRYFGRSYLVSLDHRFARSSLHLSSSRDATATAAANGVGRPLSLFQLFYDQFASLVPDPQQREQLVRDFLRAQGLDPNSSVGGGFLAGGTTVQQREDLALSFAGLRTTLTLQAYASATRRIDNATLGADLEPVRQHGVSASASYRLTPMANLSLTGLQSRTASTSLLAGNRLESLVLALSLRPGRYSSAALSLRATHATGLNASRDVALTATVGLRY